MTIAMTRFAKIKCQKHANVCCRVISTIHKDVTTCPHREGMHRRRNNTARTAEADGTGPEGASMSQASSVNAASAEPSASHGPTALATTPPTVPSHPCPGASAPFRPHPDRPAAPLPA